MNNLKALKIKAIQEDSVHKICSGQVVLSLAVAVKELVENSLDAGATNVDIRLKNYGIDSIEVSDNGSGVIEENFEALTLKYHTSKLNDYSDLLGVSSFGFRGEALSSLCALANLSITTRHKNVEYATKIEYDYKGFIIKKTPCTRQIGTTVLLTNLFASLPVRLKEFHKNAKREFNKMTQLMYAYCLISLGVKITCTNQSITNLKSTVVSTQGSLSYKDNIACVFGIKQLQNIIEIKPEQCSNIKDNIFKGLTSTIDNTDETVSIEDVDIYLSEDSNDADNKSSQSSQKSQGHKNCVDPVEFTGFISSCAHGSGRSSSDRQFYYVNSRPCEPTKLIKLINEIYRSYNPNQYPFVFLNINTERKSVDVNVTPDKRQVFLTKEKIILNVMKHSLLKLFENIPRTLKVENNLLPNNVSSKSCSSISEQPKTLNSFLQHFSKQSKNVNGSSLDDHIYKNVNELKRKSTTMLDFVSTKAKKLENNYDSENSFCDETDTKSRIESHNAEIENNHDNESSCDEIDIKSEIESQNSEIENSSVCNEMDIKTEIEFQDSKIISNSSLDLNEGKVDTEINKDIIYLEYTDGLPNTQIRKLNDAVLEKSHKIYCKTKSVKTDTKFNAQVKLHSTKSNIITDKEDFGKFNRKTVTMKTSMEHVRALREIHNQKESKIAIDRIKFKSSINPVFNKKCEEELTKEISIDSFKRMEVVGQFNLGFIIARLDNDLFIIDQHATDEIYNFETLQKKTELSNQKLVIPQQLELSGVDEQILMDNLEIFKKNGFTFDINEDAPPTKRVKLLTIPISRNWTFGKDDIEELLFMLRECPLEHCRPSRVRAMFASRACRKSVMVGTALTNSDMKKLVDHMSEIEKPWNCPHGRPTIRHLVNLTMVDFQNN